MFKTNIKNLQSKLASLMLGVLLFSSLLMLGVPIKASAAGEIQKGRITVTAWIAMPNTHLEQSAKIGIKILNIGPEFNRVTLVKDSVTIKALIDNISFSAGRAANDGFQTERGYYGSYSNLRKSGPNPMLRYFVDIPVEVEWKAGQESGSMVIELRDMNSDIYQPGVGTGVDQATITISKKAFAKTASGMRLKDSWYLPSVHFDLRASAGIVYGWARKYMSGEDCSKGAKESMISNMRYPVDPLTTFWPSALPQDNWKNFVHESHWTVYENYIGVYESKLDTTECIAEKDVAAQLPGAQQGNWFTKMLLYVLGAVASILAAVLSAEIRAVGWLFEQMSAGYGSEPVINIWKEIRNFLNIAFILALLAMAASTILGVQKDNYGIKQNLPKLIIMVVAVNFSRLFVGVVLDAANIVEAAIYQLGQMGPHGSGTTGVGCIYSTGITAGTEQGSLPCHLLRIFKVQDVSKVGSQLGAEATVATGNLSLMLSAFFMVFLLIGIVIAFLGILLILLARTIALIFLTITSPIFFVGQAFSPLKSFADQWKEKFFKYAFMHIKMAFFLTVGVMVLSNFEKVYTGNGNANSAFSEPINVPLVTGGVPLGSANVIQLNDFILMLFMFACIWMGVFSSMKSDIGAVDGIADKFTNTGKKAVGWAASHTGIPGVITPKKIGLAGKQIWQEMESTRKANERKQAGGLASVGLSGLEGIGKGFSKIDKLPGVGRLRLGKWIQEDFMGTPKGAAQRHAKAIRHETEQEYEKRWGKLGTADAKAENADARERGDVAAMNVVNKNLAENEDDSHIIFSNIMTAALKGKLNLEEAKGLLNNYKGKFGDLMGGKTILEALEKKDTEGKGTGKLDDKKVKIFFEKNKRFKDNKINENSSLKDIAEQIDQMYLNDAILIGNNKDDTQVINGVETKGHLISEFKDARQHFNKVDQKKTDGEDHDRALSRHDEATMDNNLARGNNGQLLIPQDKLIREFLGGLRVLKGEDSLDSARSQAILKNMSYYLSKMSQGEIKAIFKEQASSSAYDVFRPKGSSREDLGKLVDHVLNGLQVKTQGKDDRRRSSYDGSADLNITNTNVLVRPEVRTTTETSKEMRQVAASLRGSVVNEINRRREETREAPPTGGPRRGGSNTQGHQSGEAYA